MKRIATLVVSAVLAGFASPAALAAPTPISSCGPVSGPGSYIVTNNLSASGTCLAVTGNDVTIDFNGFVAYGDGSGDGISVNGTRFTVRNGSIVKFAVGITLLSFASLDVPGNLIEHMRIADIGNFGIGGGSAVVRDNIFTGIGNSVVGLGEGSIVTGNRIVGNRAGIAVQQGSLVSGNVVHSNTLTGLTAVCPSLVLGNTLTGNTPNLILWGAGCVTDHNVAP